MKKLLLIDGNSMLFRAYHATLYSGQMMRTSSGIATNAVYGFMNMFYKALDLLEIDAILVAFDAGKTTFRHEQFADYKGTRKEVDEDLIIQFPIVREFLDELGVKRLEMPGFEADDIIGSIAAHHPEWETTILTSDKDLLQLIDATTKVMLMKKGISEMELMDESAMQERYGFAPKRIIDLKALMGDSADNIPGVKGVGEKTALKLLQDYETLDGIYEHIAEIKGKLQEKLMQDEDNARMSYALATIKTDLDIPMQGEDFRINLNYEQLKAFYSKYEMTSFLKKLETLLSKQPQVQSEERMEVLTQFPAAFANHPSIVHFDVDNAGILLGVALRLQHVSYYLPAAALQEDATLRAYLASDCAKTLYDLKQSYHWLQERIDLKGVSLDLSVAAFLVDSSISTLDKLLAKYEISLPVTYDQAYGKGKTSGDEQQRMQYLDALLRGFETIQPLLVQEMQEQGLNALYEQVDRPLIEVLYQMEKTGVQTSLDVLRDIEVQTQAKIASVEAQIYELAGHEFNINSPKQLAVVLFDELNLKANKKRSTAIDVLEKLQFAHPMIPLLMEHRKYAKLYSTYAIGLAKHVQADGRIHTLYNQTLAQTGRLSSIEPNLQNISVRDEEAKEIRKAFVAGEGKVLLAADYSQIELRILASIANEEVMLAAFKAQKDIHTETAMAVYNVSQADVTSQMRRNAKAVNFGIVYGISDFGLSENLGITVIEARNFINAYFALYPKIHQFMDDIVETCMNQGYVSTLLGRRRYIPEIHQKNYAMREFGKRAAMNSPIQGSAADLIKLAMLKVDALMKQAKVASRMILQVHDELIFEVEESELDIMKAIVVEGMEHAMELNVPLHVDVAIGKSWYDTK